MCIWGQGLSAQGLFAGFLCSGSRYASRFIRANGVHLSMKRNSRQNICLFLAVAIVIHSERIPAAAATVPLSLNLFPPHPIPSSLSLSSNRDSASNSSSALTDDETGEECIAPA